jgi:copper(I)-binding protein
VQGQRATGAFMQLTAKESASLVAVESPVAGSVEIHEMKMENDIMKMRPIAKLDLPAGKAVEMKPGGYHVMLMDLKQPLKKGEAVPISLRFEDRDKKVRTIEIKAEVRDLAAGPPRHLVRTVRRTRPPGAGRFPRAGRRGTCRWPKPPASA